MSTIIRPTDSISTIKRKILLGGEIEFKKGTYKITSQIIVPSNTIIYGNNARLQRSSSIQSIFMNANKATDKGFGTCKNIKVYDLEFEGMQKALGKFLSGDNLVTWWKLDGLVMKNCTFIDSQLYHHMELTAVKNAQLINCKFIGNRTGDSYRESVQIGFSGASEIYKHAKGSAIYDLQCSENITFDGCRWGKSNTRTAQPVCIGMHSQPGANKLFKYITVKNCTMTGNTKYPNSPAMRFVGVENLNISNNMINGFGRGVEIRNYELSKNKNGVKVTSKSNFGLCKNILIANNTIKNATGKNRATGIYIHSMTNDTHKYVTIKDNNFIKGNSDPNEKYYIWVENTDGFKNTNNQFGTLKVYKKNVK